jgi:hypothetical protein
VDLPGHPDRPEAVHLSLTARHFPLQVTLLPRVMALFADSPDTEEEAPGLPVDQVLLRLRGWSDLDDHPLDVVLAGGQLGGDTTPPAPGEAALLRWVGAAHDRWEQDYPLEDELVQLLRRLKPLTAALAISDPQFLVPGRHPVHRLLDTIQAAAIGWQASLGRAGTGLVRDVEAAVERALRWFDEPALDLDGLVRELEARLARDGERAQKMARRVVEIERGRQKKGEAATVAAQMINAALERYEAPEQVGEFLKGPWYESAQLVALKFGAESEQWAQMSQATETLLDSLQVFETEPEGRRQHLFRIVTLLPKELRRWLMSLQHDSTAVADAVGVVEFAHLCILRRSPLDTVRIAPLAVAAGGENAQENASEQQCCEVGQWYLIRPADREHLRARIILRLQREGQLLFANRAGLEILRLDQADFAEMLESGAAVPLQRGASFSRSLAAAAGVTQESDLEGLAECEAPPPATAPETAPCEPGPGPETEEGEQERLWREWQEARARQEALNQGEGSGPP